MEVFGGKRRNRILVVSDDAAARRRLGAILNGRYEVIECGVRCSNALLETTRRIPPDLVLLDVSEPGPSSHEVCMALKRHAPTLSIPVIFHCGVVGQGVHPSGVDPANLSARPLQTEDLPARIARILRDTEEPRHRLAAGLASGTTAKPVTLFDIGVIKRGVREINEGHAYASLGDTLIAACAAFGLKAAVQIRGRQGIESRDDRGEASPFNAALLDKLSGFDSIVDFYSCAVFGCEHATLVVTDMPRDNQGRLSRLFDHLALLIHCASDRVREVDKPVSAIASRESPPALLKASPLAA